jgi:drug/metabolite transporter (DMT)-like permease
VVAAILASMFLGEPLTVVQAAGGSIVIAGIVLARRGAS